MKAFLALLAFLLAAPPAFACSCGQPETLSQRFNSATAVAVVRVVSASPGEYEPPGIYSESGKIRVRQRAIFGKAKVVEQLKGVVKSPSVIIARPPDSFCSVPLTVGQTYVVFVTGGGPINHSFCSAQPLLQHVGPALMRRWRGR